MEDDYERILAELTETQRECLVRTVRDKLWIPPSPDDLAALMDLDLFEYPETTPHRETYTGNRESTSDRGVPRPSPLGEKWVAWYLAKQKK